MADFPTSGPISISSIREFMNGRDGVSVDANNVSVDNLFSTASNNQIFLGNGDFVKPHSLSEFLGANYTNNTPPVISLLGPQGFWVNNQVRNFGVPESYALSMQVCNPDADFETEDWKYDNEHYVATYIHMSSLVDYSGGWPVSIAVARLIRAFFYGDDQYSTDPSYPSDLSDAQGNNILNVMDENFKNNIFYKNYNVGYIARKVHLFELWDNGANYYQEAMRRLYSDIYNDNRPNFSGTYEARSYTDTSNGGYIFGKFCAGPSTWGTSNYYDPFQPSAIAYKESKGYGMIGATDTHSEVFNNLNAPGGIGYYLHPIRKIS